MKPFDSVVREHGATVYRVVRAVVGSNDADDAWSETFLSALEAYPRLAPGSNVRGWLVTIAHRKAIDVVRKQSRLVVTDAVPDRPGASEPPDLDLRRALAALPQQQRSSVVLHHVGGLPFAEVAQTLGISVVAARKSSSDGIATLRKRLGEGSESD